MVDVGAWLGATRSALSTILYCIWWPTSKLLLAIGTILSPVLAFIQFIFLPLTLLIQAIIAVVTFPFRLHVLERIETIYIWLGTATLIGCITGLVLFLIYKVLTSAIGIDAAAEAERKKQKARTVKDFRQARLEKLEAPANGVSMSNVIKRERDPRARSQEWKQEWRTQALIEDETEF